MKSYALSLLAAALLLLGSCKKEADVIDCIEPSVSALATLIAKHEVPVQQFSILPGTSSNIKTAAGYQIYVPADLVRIDGGRLSTSPVQVQVREITNRGEMIFTHTPTASGRRLLESGGMFNITFKQDNQPLQLSSNSSLIVLTTAPRNLSTSEGMRLFMAQPDSVNSQQVGSWTSLPVQAQDTTTRIFTQTTTPGTPASGSWVRLSFGVYNYNLQGLNWINCDRFVTATPTTVVRVTIDKPAVNNSNTRTFLVFNTLNSVLMPNLNYVSGDVFHEYGVPVGYSITAVVLHHDGNQLYFGKQTATIAANQQFRPTLRAITEEELVSEIEALK
ncbi:hypothetical protein [Hymenobacter sp. YC55]|uniref:hypothetical protein n=1 Tax=Hymenobacter sp. YC55 TaxID=3034019 RepID=UPI0023F9C4DB|nr:hypothetical protein [Hymenobacter sp. YC55]MDF7810872.1 hypothetical protein [Hymenobacter sp. YC55]